MQSIYDRLAQQGVDRDTLAQSVNDELDAVQAALATAQADLNTAEAAIDVLEGDRLQRIGEAYNAGAPNPGVAQSATVAMPANTLAVDGDFVVVFYNGYITNGVGGNGVRLRFGGSGGTVVHQSGPSFDQNTAGLVFMRRTGASSQAYLVFEFGAITDPESVRLSVGTTAKDLTAAQDWYLHSEEGGAGTTDQRARHLVVFKVPK